MNVARRTCGYIGTQFWNQGRTQEIKERVMHLQAKPKERPYQRGRFFHFFIFDREKMRRDVDYLSIFALKYIK